MALVRFLDGKQAGKTAQVDDAALTAEGRYHFKKRDLSPSGGRPYYLKRVPEQRWVKAEVVEWTAALDDDDED